MEVASGRYDNNNNNNNNNNNIERSGIWCNQSAQFIEDLGRRINAITNDQLKTTYLFKRLSCSLQRGNAVAFSNTFPQS